MKFKKGDVVVCIQSKDSSYEGEPVVTAGREYVIRSVYMDGTRQMVYLEGERFRNINLYATRFESVIGYCADPILRRIKKMEERFNKRKSPCAA